MKRILTMLMIVFMAGFARAEVLDVGAKPC
jgi:hypothetical protein